MVPRRTAWTITSSVYHWITGLFGLVSGFLALAFSGLVLDLLNRRGPILDSSCETILSCTDVQAIIAPGSIGLVSMIVIGMLLSITAITAAVGLYSGRRWGCVLSNIIHAVNVILALIAIVIWIGTGWLGLSFIPFVILGLNVVLIVGPLLPNNVCPPSLPSVGPCPPHALPYGHPSIGPQVSYEGRLSAQLAGAVVGAGQCWPGGVAHTEVAAPVSGVLAWLIESNGPHAGRQYRLGPQVTIGRDRACADLVIDDSKVSGTHARVRFEQGQYVIYDLGSTNKTFVNGQQVTTQVLKDGDQISLGPNVQLIFKIV